MPSPKSVHKTASVGSFGDHPFLGSPKSVHKTAKVGSYARTVRKVSVQLPALAVLVAARKTASVGSFDGTFKTAVCGSCSQVYSNTPLKWPLLWSHKQLQTEQGEPEKHIEL